MIKRKDIPKKLRKTEKSFVQTLANESPDKGLLRVFPKDVSFHGQDKDEDIVLVARAHWITWIPQIFFSIMLAILPFLLMFLLTEIGVSMTIGLIILGLIVSITTLLNAFFKWFYSVNIITTQRIIDVDFVNAFQHRFSEAQLEKIEDISHEHIGFLGSMFDVGTVYIQTAASQAEFEFQNIPRPRDVQDTLNDLLEMKQKGDI
jgi:hypothetical protein